MTTEDFIIDLFCRIDDTMKDLNKDSQAILYPSEIVTLAILFAIKGVGNFFLGYLIAPVCSKPLEIGPTAS